MDEYRANLHGQEMQQEVNLDNIWVSIDNAPRAYIMLSAQDKAISLNVTHSTCQLCKTCSKGQYNGMCVNVQCAHYRKQPGRILSKLSDGVSRKLFHASQRKIGRFSYAPEER